MTQTQATTMLFGGVALLERAISYALGSLLLVTAEAMTRPTPCRAWDLRALLAHMNDSLIALQEAVDLGQIQLTPQADEPDPTVNPVAALRNRACRLLGAWTNTDGIDPVSIGGCALTTRMVTCAGAIEIAIHGWDVAQACSQQRPLPPSLAEVLLACAPAFVTDVDRPARFAVAVDPPLWASAGDRLLALLGRVPHG
jgi:uncharacterized protein (TIGR03086 family)